MARTTDKRERILEYIIQFTRENGYSPSVREICEGVGLASTATVHYHLNALRQEGSINMDGKKNRTISLPDRLPIAEALPTLPSRPCARPCDAPWRQRTRHNSGRL